MTFRSVMLGLLLGLSIALLAHFNDQIINQTYFTGNFIPPVVFGTVVLLSLMLGIGIGRRHGLGPSELAVVAALGLAGAGWVGLSFGHAFTAIVATPWHWRQTQTGWQTSAMMGYLPRGMPEVGPGHVRDWDRLVDVILTTSDNDPAGRPWRGVREELGPGRVGEFRAQREAGGSVRSEQQAVLLLAINRAILANTPVDDVDLAQWDLPGPAGEIAQRIMAGEDVPEADRQVVSRALLSAAAPEALRPMAGGEGLLLPYGGPTLEAVNDMIPGVNTDAPPWRWVEQPPWTVWWSALRVWAPILGGLAVALVCMSLIVHPQWVYHERLTFPVARFLDEFLRMRSGATLRQDIPDDRVLGMPRMFWMGFGPILALHALNSLHLMEPAMPHVPLRFDFSGLQPLFPSSIQSQMATQALFTPTLYPSVVAFAMLVPRRVSLSFGMATYVWIAFELLMIKWGIQVSGSRFGDQPKPMMLFGGYVGAAAILIYVGRTYYAHVCRATFGFGRSTEVPGYAAWAGRGLILGVAAMVAGLRWAGMDWTFAVFCTAAIVLMYTVMTRIAAETGVLYLQSGWAPIGVVLGLLGFSAVGPTDLLLIGIFSAVLALDVRDIFMPHVQHGLYLASREGGPRRMACFAPLMLAAVLGLLVVVVVVSVTLEHQYGIARHRFWPTHNMPRLPFGTSQSSIVEAQLLDDLGPSMDRIGLGHLAAAHSDDGQWRWVLLGMVLVVGTSLARLKLAWWPIHPVMFLIWGTLGPAVFAISFLLGCAAKLATVKIGGARGYNMVKPLMYGVICGEVVAALLWIVGGFVYFGLTNLSPPEYRIFPV